jgi:hypothetical protein
MALAAVYSVFVELSAILAVENLLTPLVLAAVWAMLRARHSPRPYARIVASGTALGLAVLTHEDAAVLTLPLAWAAWTVLPGRPATSAAGRAGGPACHGSRAARALDGPQRGSPEPLRARLRRNREYARRHLQAELGRFSPRAVQVASTSPSRLIAHSPGRHAG